MAKNGPPYPARNEPKPTKEQLRKEVAEAEKKFGDKPPKGK